MLLFLFSFCGTKGDAAEVGPKGDDLIKAFGEVQKLASEQNTPLRSGVGAA